MTKKTTKPVSKTEPKPGFTKLFLTAIEEKEEEIEGVKKYGYKLTEEGAHVEAKRPPQELIQDRLSKEKSELETLQATIQEWRLQKVAESSLSVAMVEEQYRQGVINGLSIALAEFEK